MCTLPFSLKVLWSPFVDLYYSKGFGRRKSWIIPTQVIMSVILFYLQGTIESMLEQKEVYLLTGIFTFMIFVITCQDIAVDSWAVEILHSEHAGYASTCQSVGQKIGIFLSTSMFIALHSVDFCNTYLYSTPQTEPFLPLPTFIKVWSYFQLIVTILIAFFVSEKHQDRTLEAQEEHHYSLSQVFIILKDVLKNPNLQLFFVFRCLMVGTLMLNSNLGQVYLTNDLKFPAEKLSLI